MKRLLIFAVLFPPLALVIFNAPDMIARHDFRLMDSASFQAVYAIAVIPAFCWPGSIGRFRQSRPVCGLRERRSRQPWLQS